jgi:tetratricopeptide (TPR) repeat protein
VNEIIQADYNHSYQPTEKDIGHVLQIFRVFMKLYLSVCLFCIGTVAAMGSGSAGGGSAKSKSLQQEVGSSAFEVYNQGVDLMHAKKFAEAQMKFEQAIRDNPNFAEAHNNLGFTLRQQGPQNYSKALEHCWGFVDSAKATTHMSLHSYRVEFFEIASRKGRWWYETLDQSGIEDQFTFFYGLINISIVRLELRRVS